MTKYQPLFDLDQLVQLTHSTQGKAIFYSQVHLSATDDATILAQDANEGGGWILSAFTGKTYFEREYRRDELDDLLERAGDKDWASFSQRFKRAILEGYFHIVDKNPRECDVIVDNEVHTRASHTGGKDSGGENGGQTLETIEIDMRPVTHQSRGEKVGEFMFECASFIQARGCFLSAEASSSGSGSGSGSNKTSAGAGGVPAGVGSGGKSYDDIKQERDHFRTENAALRKEIETLRAAAISQGAFGHSGVGAGSGRPKTKANEMAKMFNAQALRKRKGASTLNPRSKKATVAMGTEFDDDDEEEDDDGA